MTTDGLKCRTLNTSDNGTVRRYNVFLPVSLFHRFGGSVDIGLYEKLEDDRIKELCAASGGPFGGTAVDEAFIQLLARAFGDPMMNEFRKKHNVDFLDMMKEFEVAKRNLKPSGSRPFNTKLPISFGTCCEQKNKENLKEVVSGNKFPFKGNIKLRYDKLSIEATLMLEIFSSVTTKITDIAQGVLKQPVAEACQLILLVGGFAESECVQEAIKDEFETKERRVIVPAESGLTVVKGATIFGHRNKGIVTERIMRYTYGIATNAKFDRTKHDPGYKEEVLGKGVIVQEFSPFMKKGTSVKEGTIVSRSYLFNPFNARAGITVYTSTRNVKFIQEGGLEKLATIYIDEDAKKYYGKRVDIKVFYTFGNTELQIDVLCLQTGKTFSAKVANYT